MIRSAGDGTRAGAAGVVGLGFSVGADEEPERRDLRPFTRQKVCFLGWVCFFSSLKGMIGAPPSSVGNRSARLEGRQRNDLHPY